MQTSGLAGDRHIPPGTRWVQPSTDMSPMDAKGGGSILRVHVDDIKSFRKEFWKQELPVIVTGVHDLGHESRLTLANCHTHP